MGPKLVAYSLPHFFKKVYSDVSFMNISPWHGQTVVIATMHGKEQVIAPRLEAILGVVTAVPENFDTDRFGTFTREVKRVGDQREAARRKASAAIAKTGHTLAVASEGSFGPHPALPFAQVGNELVLFYDAAHDLEVVGVASFLRTNLAHATIRNTDELRAFATHVGFPEHGVIVRRSESGGPIYKECRTMGELESAAAKLLRPFWRRSIFVETDMRAHRNPTRQAGIAKATEVLIENLLRSCPACSSPGFSPVAAIAGATCEQCGRATEVPRADRYRCPACSYETEIPRSLATTGAANCGFCNP
jgi:hypothetical protein